ncbi:insulin-like protein growth factor 2 mRNA-binding protein 1-like, partial [Euroglyphus maynei]
MFRILVLKDLVGAIIGRGGGTIRQITQETHARVDVHRKESSSASENIIMIYGNPDNCSQACRRILEVMQQEAKSLNRPDEIQLKILAANNLIGRIIGKGGNTIRRIMQQTDTKITINSANLASQYQLERIISISGQLENMCKAEMMISQKLRQCFESDCIQYQQSLMYHHPTGFHHSSLPPSSLLQPGQSTSGAPMGIPYSLGPGSHSPQLQPPMSYSALGASPTCSNLPPSALVGRSSAVMGSSSVTSPTTSATGPLQSGSQPHSVPSSSTQGPAATTAFYNPYNFAPFMYSPHGPQGSLGAPTSPFIGAGTQNVPPPYMSTYLCSSMLPNMDNVKETVTIYIPNSVVGAIIGRGGSTIREMMNNSGATIKVAQMNEEDASLSTAIDSSSSTARKPLER